MKLYRALLIILFFVPIIASAQGNYKPGFVITSNSDTIKGDVLYKKWTNNPAEFSFKSTNGNKMECDAHNTELISISGRATYKRAIVWVSQDSPANLNFIPGTDNAIGIDSTKKLDTIFLKMVVSGKNLALYSFTDFTKQRFFVSEKDKTPIELALHQYLEQEPKLTVVEDKKYKNQLQVLRTLYAPDDIAIIDKIQLADYNESDLSAIVNKLNNAPAK